MSGECSFQVGKQPCPHMGGQGSSLRSSLWSHSKAPAIAASQLHGTGGSGFNIWMVGGGDTTFSPCCGRQSSGHPASLPTQSPLYPPSPWQQPTHAPPFPAPEGELRAKTRYYSAWPAIEASMVTPWGPRLKETSAWKLRFLRLQSAAFTHHPESSVGPKCEPFGDLPNYKASIHSLATS